MLFVNPDSETELVYKEDTDQEMILERLDEEREASVSDIQEKEGTEEQTHQVYKIIMCVCHPKCLQYRPLTYTVCIFSFLIRYINSVSL